MAAEDLRNLIRVRLTTPDQYVLFFSLLLILLGVIVVPLAYILAFSFAPEFPLRGAFIPTLEHYVRLVRDVDLLMEITVDTVIFATGNVLLALTIGVTAAVFEEKYFGGRSNFRILMMLPYGIPTVASVTGWIWLMGRSGVITQAVMGLFNLQRPPWDIYSMWGMIFVDGIHAAPLAFLLIAPSIRSIPAAAEEAGLASGASRLTVYRKIVLPLVLPAILSISIFLLARSMAVVTVPAVLGVPKDIYTFGSAIPFLFLSGFELDFSLSLAFGVYITIITTGLILIYYRAIDKAEKYATVSGQGSAEPKIYQVGPVKKALIGGFFVAYLVIGGLLPFWAIIWDSLLPAFDFTLDPAVMTLDKYVALYNGTLLGVPDVIGT
ncbi:MAG: ABC transporter permease subunit, partial [Halobacteriales archaeon]|nr:ABC transporter permease subunit [Halobacteriales archaeon]